MDVVAVPSAGAGSGTAEIPAALQTRPPHTPLLAAFEVPAARRASAACSPVPSQPRGTLFTPDIPESCAALSAAAARAKARSCPGARLRRARGGRGRRSRPSAGAEL
ncbi:unnamed protein product [Coccothraustes coccothraustes]